MDIFLIITQLTFFGYFYLIKELVFMKDTFTNQLVLHKYHNPINIPWIFLFNQKLVFDYVKISKKCLLKYGIFARLIDSYVYP